MKLYRSIGAQIMYQVKINLKLGSLFTKITFPSRYDQDEFENFLFLQALKLYRKYGHRNSRKKGVSEIVHMKEIFVINDPNLCKQIWFEL